MEKKYKEYIRKVVSNINCDYQLKKRIESDLYEIMMEKHGETGIEDPFLLMGDPEKVAEEFKENLNIKEDYYHKGRFYDIRGIPRNMEYKSEKMIFGIPLIHINNRPYGVAKGIIAIGSFSIGVISLGGFSLGLISFGGFGAGILMAFGGVALGGLFAIGGMALSLLWAIGGMAIAGYGAIGGYAQAGYFAAGGKAVAGEIAIGSVAEANVAIYRQRGYGNYLFNFDEISLKQIAEKVKMIIPEVPDYICDMIRNFTGGFRY